MDARDVAGDQTGRVRRSDDVSSNGANSNDVTGDNRQHRVPARGGGRARKPLTERLHAPDPGDSAPDDDKLVQRTALSDRQLMLIGGTGIALIAITLLFARNSWLSPVDAIVLGAVEGITEFLPISSTGHLLITERLLGLGQGFLKEATDSYTIAIQIGAIFAVVGVYRARIGSMLNGVIGRDRQGLKLLELLLIAFAPAAVVGLILNDTIKSTLFGVWPVIIAWAAGGIFLLAWEPKPGRTPIGMITRQQALVIGSAQVLALWPGTSRSLVTIVAALAVGLTMSAAVEFSFLLGLGTLSAATVLDLAKNGSVIVDRFGYLTPLLGTAIACLTAFVAVNWLVTYLQSHSLRVFGWYRIGIAVVTVILVTFRVI